MTEPIAIIGLGCRFPGAESPDAFWRLLRDGVDAISEVPADRWDVDAFYDPRPGIRGKMPVRWGGFLEQVDQFDPQFFGISPREAMRMDPQQRLLLEVAWEALEDAGQAVERLSGTPTGVFIGISGNDYGRMQMFPGLTDAYMGTGNANSVAANRLSYVLDLQGPSLTVDTACSSSLVAVHLACRSLWSGESALALVGGVSAILSPTITINFSLAGMLSPEGRCKTFDASADGYVRGEGAGVVVLKPLSKARADRDPIYAVICATAVNQDGHSQGLTVPSQQAQEAVLREAYRAAGVRPGDVGYVEAHGTGTPVGDPIEASALGAVLAEGRRPDRPCAIGSVKTNIGHLEAASGIAGLIKVALVLKKGEIPPSLHFHHPNPGIPFHELPLRVQTALGPWPEGSGPRLAGLNSFGFGGTNAHVVLEGIGESPGDVGPPAPTSSSHRRTAYVLPLSARSPEALRSLAEAYRAAVRSRGPNWELRDVCYTASVRRSRLDHGLAVVARSWEELDERLDAFGRGEPRPGTYAGARRAGAAPKLVFVFPGQGSQWWAMGRQLLELESAFRETVERCDELLFPLAGWSLLGELTAAEAESRLDETEIAQPALFALHMGLASLWRSLGVVPHAVVGHSVGEVAAACVSGALSLEDAIRVIYHRGRLMHRASGLGKMAAVELPWDEAQRAISDYEGRLFVAAHNGPTSTTLSGEPDALLEVLDTLQQRGVFVRLLQVDYAFHSAQMEPYLVELVESLEGLEPRAAAIPIVSTLTGRPSEGEIFDAEYWARNVRQPVLFANAIDGLVEDGHDVYLELGPHPTLFGPISSCLHHRGHDGVVLASLRRGEEEQTTILGSLGALATLGFPVEWSQLYPDGARCVPLPSYPWQRERHWLEIEEADVGGGAWVGPASAAKHPLLGRPFESALPVWEVELDQGFPQYLSDHRIHGDVLLPGTAFVEMGLAAANEVFGAGRRTLADIVFHNALALPESGGRRVQVVLSPQPNGEATFAIHSRPADGEGSRDGWTLHASGHVRPESMSGPPSIPTWATLTEMKSRCQEEISVEELYRDLERQGFAYGPCFRGIDQLWRREGEALARLRVPRPLEADVSNYQIHPAVLDACFQVLAATLRGELADGGSGDLYLPVGVERVRVYDRPGLDLWGFARLRSDGARDEKASFVGDLRLLDGAGQLLVEVSGLRVQRLERRATSEAEDPRDWLCRLVWERKPRPGEEISYLPPDYMPSIDSIAERLSVLKSEMSAQQDREALSRYGEIEALGPVYILKALRELGWEPRPQARVATAALAEELGVASHFVRYLDRLLERLSEEGILSKVGAEWEVSRVPADAEPEDVRRPLLDRHPAFEAELTLAGRCGQRLADVLRGECDPLQLLFPEGSIATAESLYQDSPFVWTYNRLVQEAIAAALERLPEDRTVRVLEIGTGTGGTTPYVLPGLPADRSEYVVTDVSKLFLAHADRKFRQYPFVRSQLLDIERDPLSQGFDAHSFDVVLAGHVLHATSDLRQTLRHVQSLLKPEGLLVLLEGTGLHILYDLVFAMTEGWWKFTDRDLRPSHPLLSQQKWREVLEEVGFRDAIAVPEEEDTRSDPSRQAVVVARAPHVEENVEAVPVAATPERRGTWLVLADAGDVGQRLAALLQSQGERTVLALASDRYEPAMPDHYRLDPSRPEDFRRLLDDALGDDESCRGVVHLWSLDADSNDETPVAAIEAAQRLVCESTLYLVQALSRRVGTDPPRLWLGTRGAQPVKETDSVSVAQSPLWGLGRVIASEHPGFRCTNVDLGEAVSPEELSSLLRELFVGDREDQIALRGESRYVRRLVRGWSRGHVETKRVQASAQPFRLEIVTPGMLDTLTLRQAKRREPGPGEVEIEVVAAGLNFRDVMKAMGLYPAAPGELTWLGDECSGRVVALGEGVEELEIGDEVIATGPACIGAFATTRAEFVAPKPSHLSFEEATTVPVAFLTACYALRHLAGLGEGERVLIHAAAGGVGLAAVQLARVAGAEIFATAGSPEKREFLRSLGIAHVMDSRSLSFADEVMELTGGEGVDVVLNSLAGEAIVKSLSLLRPNGRFLEIGKRDIYQNSQLGLRSLRNNIAFFAIDLSSMFVARPDFCGNMLRGLMKEIDDATLEPLPLRVFPVSEVESAFRHMAEARHIGKIVLSLEEEEVMVARAADEDLRLDADATFLVTGGLGGFGLEVARWMVGQGARHLVLMGRRGVQTSETREAVDALRSAGAEVVVATADVSNDGDVARVLGDIHASMPPLRGVVHAAMVLDDAPVLELDRDRLRAAMAPKMNGAWNLHRSTAAARLDFFVLFSSAASLIGSPGQANYVAGNAFLESLAHYRRARGLPAMTIQWGRLTDVGYVARHEEVGERLERLGLRGFSPAQAVTMLGRLIQLDPVEMGVVRTDWSQWRKYHSATSVLLSHFQSDSSGDATGDRSALRATILSAASDERQPLMESYVQRELGRVLRLDASRVDVHKPLNTLGLDSLMAVELTTRIETDLGVAFPMAVLAQGASISQLATRLTGLVAEEASDLVGARAPEVDLAPGLADADALSARLDELSDQEVDSLLSEIVTPEDLFGRKGGP